MKQCSECLEDFDERSPEKKRAGGKINHCPKCSEEVEPKALGFASGDGKMASLSILKFKTQQDADDYKTYFRKASGMHQGKSCSLHKPGMTAPGVSFTIVSTSESMNHKGKQ